jgi:eukaryotic-like serine/threonine-protein kinase
MSQINAEQLAQRIFDVGLMTSKEIENVLQAAGGRGTASFDSLVFALLEREALTNWQISRLVEGHLQGFYYGNWLILYLIGHGTFARVYRAVHRKTGDIKAVKVLRNRYSSDLEQREQFLREARMVMKLRHPNIVPIHEVEEEKGRIYMVMDFVEGQNLREYVHAHRRLGFMTSLKIIRDIAAGLAYASQFNITHRDLKLSNVLLSSKGQAKLVDFGLAAVNAPDEKGEKGGPRSIDYAGLERTTGSRRNDPRSDIYFCGCMLYHMISGVSPLFETRERMKRLSSQRYTDVKPINQIVPEVPHRVAILIGHLMDLDIEKRIQNQALVVQETEAVIHALEAGDTARFDANLTEEQAQQYANLQSRRIEGAGKTILLIESNIKLQNTLRERLKSAGYRVLITADPVRGLAKFADLEPGDSDSPADAVLFGCGGLGRAGILAFTQFAAGKATGQIPAILLVTEQLASQVRPELINEVRDVIALPLKVRKLRSKLRVLLKIEEPAETAKSTGNSKLGTKSRSELTGSKLSSKATSDDTDLEDDEDEDDAAIG